MFWFRPKFHLLAKQGARRKWRWYVYSIGDQNVGQVVFADGEEIGQGPPHGGPTLVLAVGQARAAMRGWTQGSIKIVEFVPKPPVEVKDGP